MLSEAKTKAENKSQSETELPCYNKYNTGTPEANTKLLLLWQARSFI
jgi:hypothetical protein